MITKIKNFLKWIWNECKDWHTLILLLCVIIVMYSPVWGGYLLYAAFGWAWCSAIASAYLLFWAGPFTPFFPMCIGITLFIKKVMQVKSGRYKTSAIKDGFEIQNKSHNNDVKNKDYSITLRGHIRGAVFSGIGNKRKPPAKPVVMIRKLIKDIFTDSLNNMVKLLKEV